ncbi:MAG: CDP-alcohol phosphatidyltransferase family protein [Acidobacteria bacterium]|nr:CDP-alcohol phosphatidyltransferase family protein [Acidobacteriota bacterium]
MLRHLPNLITSVRILLTPYLGFLIARGQYRPAFFLLMAAGLSDGLDGWLSRRFHWQSDLGARLDPIADKLLLATLFLGLGFAGALPWWIVILSFSRDLLILAFAAYAWRAHGLRSFPPSIWGKLSTLLQLLLCGGALLRNLWPDFFLAALVPTVLYLSAAATSWSGIDYGLTGARMLRRPDASAGTSAD